eukprot:scaffold58996_cov23-Prasinocladus_malaysianus.AAC.1
MNGSLWYWAYAGANMYAFNASHNLKPSLQLLNDSSWDDNDSWVTVVEAFLVDGNQPFKLGCVFVDKGSGLTRACVSCCKPRHH